MNAIRWEAAGASDVGRKRRGNEDAFLVEPGHGVFLVADGMGGHAAGEVASSLASETVGRALLEAAAAGTDPAALAERMVASFQEAHRIITTRTLEDPATSGMGTTLTACVASTAGTLRIGHIGDSRAYRFRGKKLAQLTRDHTWVQDQVDAGRLTPAEARTHRLSHIITRALGADSADEPDLLETELVPGDLLLLCTDGLSGMVTDTGIARILARDAPLEELVARLVETANAKGGNDNVTVVLVRVLAPVDSSSQD